MSREEVEALQVAIEEVGRECKSDGDSVGVDLKKGMPRVGDVTEKDDLSGL